MGIDYQIQYRKETMSQLDKQMEQAHEVDEPKVVLNGTTYMVSDMDERSVYLYDQTMDLVEKKNTLEGQMKDARFNLDQVLVALEGMQNKLQEALEPVSEETPPEVVLPEEK